MSQSNTYPRLVSWFYNSMDGVFNKSNDKEFATEISIIDPKGEKILKNGQLACLNSGVFGLHVKDPYFKRFRIEGYTKRARNHGKVRRDLEKRYPDLQNAVTKIKSIVKPYGDYVFIDLSHLDNYFNPMVKDPEFYSENFVYAKDFDEKFVVKLLDYKPRDMMGEVINSYQQKDVPKLLDSLRFEFPDLYNSLVKTNERVREFNEKFTFNGKSAKVKTLKSGKVELRLGFIDTQIFDWNGKVLTNKAEMYDGSIVIQSITPSDDTTVKLLSDEGVTEDTQFVD